VRNNPNSEDNLVPFKKGKDSRRNMSGRPRKLISQTIKDLKEAGVKETTSVEIKAVYLMLINLTKKDLQDKMADPDQSILVRTVADAIINGKGFEIIEKMLDRSIGKAQDKVDITSGGEKVDPWKITFDRDE
jgi:hypothetical protein